MINEQPGQIIELPKADKRYKVGNIAKDRTGQLRGNPLTVTPRVMDIPKSAPLSMQLNPPLVISNELADLLEEQL